MNQPFGPALNIRVLNNSTNIDINIQKASKYFCDKQKVSHDK